jgi:hypothetical protein
MKKHAPPPIQAKQKPGHRPPGAPARPLPAGTLQRASLLGRAAIVRPAVPAPYRFRYRGGGPFIDVEPQRQVANYGGKRNEKVTLTVHVDGTRTGMIGVYLIEPATGKGYLDDFDTKGKGYDKLEGVGALLVYLAAREMSAVEAYDVRIPLPAPPMKGFYLHLGFEEQHGTHELKGEAGEIYERARASVFARFETA